MFQTWSQLEREFFAFWENFTLADGLDLRRKLIYWILLNSVEPVKYFREKFTLKLHPKIIIIIAFGGLFARLSHADHHHHTLAAAVAVAVAVAVAFTTNNIAEIELNLYIYVCIETGSSKQTANKLLSLTMHSRWWRMRQLSAQRDEYKWKWENK